MYKIVYMTTTTVVSFGSFTLNSAKRELYQNGQQLKLSDKDFDVLVFLVSNHLVTVSVDQIIEAVWAGTNVENNSVEKAIVNIRNVLGDDARNPRYIKTVRSKGYLFIADIELRDNRTDDKKTLNIIECEENIEIAPVKTLRARKSAQSSSYLVAFIFMICLGVGIYITTTYFSRISEESKILFSDDFSDKELNADKWKTVGNSVRVENGNAIISIDETDKGGRLFSSYFTYDPNKPIVVSSRLKISPSKNINQYNFHGQFYLIPRVFSKDIEEVIEKFGTSDDMKLDHTAFGITYMNSEYSSGEVVSVEGFFLIRPEGRPNTTFSYKRNDVSQRIEPVWNKWFDQKIIYDPVTGQIEYFIDSEIRAEFNCGKIPPLNDYQMQLYMTPWGWYTNHSMEIDHITVTQ